MPKSTTTYDILFSCPGDLTGDIEIVKKCIDRFNEVIGEQYNVSLKLKHWSVSSYPESGKPGQPTLNEQFVEDCDAAIAIFWSRFGTPTDKYGSGTEEEIQIMLDQNKQVFMYFCKKNLPYDVKLEDVQKIRTFKEAYKKKGLYAEYESDFELEVRLEQDLMKWYKKIQKNGFDTTSVTAETNTSNTESVKILYKNDSEAQRLTPKLLTLSNFSEYDTKAKSLISKINSLNISSTDEKKEFDVFADPLNDDFETIKKRIAQFDQNIHDLDAFICVGNLKRSISGDLVGDNDSKDKYSALIELNSLLIEKEFLKSMQEAFNGSKHYYFEFSNNLGYEMRDISLTLITNVKDLFDLKRKFPIPQEHDALTYISNNLLEKLFSSYSSDKYYGVYGNIFDIIGNSLNPTNSYKRTLNKIFCYNIKEQNEEIHLTLPISILKNGEKILLPSQLFFNKNDAPILVNYEIICSNIPDIIKGSLTIAP